MRISDWSSDVCSSDLISPLMQNTTEGPNQQWGVTGVMPGSSPDPNEVQAFTQIGDTVYVGGKFQYVQQGANGTRILQSRLAAFDAVTGERSEEHTSELQSLMRNSYADCCLKKKTKT